MQNTQKLSSGQVYPLAYGNEEETGLLDNFCGEMAEPYELAGDLASYIPKEIPYAKHREALYLQNGAKLYPGRGAGTSLSTNIEHASPECRTPRQLATYIRAGELIVANTVQSFLDITSGGTQINMKARMQRRVVDSLGNRKGLHDNFGIDKQSALAGAASLPDQILAHLGSRSFITGAGYASAYGPQYAQKIGGLGFVKGYGFVGSMYRIALTEGTPRIEIRCGDINISDWAARVRIGSTAIALALNQTPLGKKLPDTSESDALVFARQMNKMQLNINGTIAPSQDILAAVDFQQSQAELALSELEDYTDPLPPELYWTAREVYNYCQDFKNVISGDVSIRILADRADWAAKFSWILDRLVQDDSRGIDRDLVDINSQAADMRYDYIGLSSSEGNAIRPVHGYGYRLRKRGKFKGGPITDSEISSAYNNAPRETRAVLRSHLIVNYPVSSCNWHTVTLSDEDYADAFKFEDVLQTSFTENDLARLELFKRFS